MMNTNPIVNMSPNYEAEPRNAVFTRKPAAMLICIYILSLLT